MNSQTALTNAITALNAAVIVLQQVQAANVAEDTKKAVTPSHWYGKDGQLLLARQSLPGCKAFANAPRWNNFGKEIKKSTREARFESLKGSISDRVEDIANANSGVIMSLREIYELLRSIGYANSSIGLNSDGSFFNDCSKKFVENCHYPHASRADTSPVFIIDSTVSKGCAKSNR